MATDKRDIEYRRQLSMAGAHLGGMCTRHGADSPEAAAARREVNALQARRAVRLLVTAGMDRTQRAAMLVACVLELAADDILVEQDEHSIRVELTA